MTAVWDKLFGNAPYPANDAVFPRLLSPLARDDDDEPPPRDDPRSSRLAQSERRSPTGKTVASTFDSIGRRNEDLRAQLDAIEFAFSNIEIIRSHFLGLLGPVDEILREIEHTNTKRHDAESKLDALATLYEKLRGEFGELTVDRNALALKHGEFNLRIADADKALQKATAELAEARAGMTTHSARADRLERDLEESKRRLAAVSEQLPSLRAEFLAKEKRLQEVEQQRTSLLDSQKLAAQEIRTSRARIEEMVAGASKLNRKINELESRNTDAARRVGELEGVLAQEIAAHARLKAVQFDDDDAHRTTVAKLQEELNALNARSEGVERLLQDARGELRERNATIRAFEQDALETSVLLQTRDQSQAEMELTLSSAHAKLSETEVARATLEARAGDLSRALEAETTALKRAEGQVAALEARMAAEVKLAISELESRDAAIARLRADLEAQSSARAFAEGALQSARQERVPWRSAKEAPGETMNEGNREKISRLRA